MVRIIRLFWSLREWQRMALLGLIGGLIYAAAH